MLKFQILTFHRIIFAYHLQESQPQNDRSELQRCRIRYRLKIPDKTNARDLQVIMAIGTNLEQHDYYKMAVEVYFLEALDKQLRDVGYETQFQTAATHDSSLSADGFSTKDSSKKGSQDVSSTARSGASKRSAVRQNADAAASVRQNAGECNETRNDLSSKF